MQLTPMFTSESQMPQTIHVSTGLKNLLRQKRLTLTVSSAVFTT